MSDEMVMLVERRRWDPHFDVLLFEDRPGARRAVIEVKTVEVADGEQIRPSFGLSPSAAQALFQQLWDCGLRPVDGTGSTGQLAATERHLEDMRSLVAHALSVALERE